MEQRQQRDLGLLIAIQGATRGSFCSTTALRLAQIYAYSAQSTLLIDLGFRGQATRRLGATGTDSQLLSQVILGKEPSSRLGLLIRSVAAGLDLIPHDLSLDEIESVEESAQGSWRDTLDAFRRQYRVILLDCPPRDDNRSEALRASAPRNLLLAAEEPPEPEFREAPGERWWCSRIERSPKSMTASSRDLDASSTYWEAAPIPYDSNFDRPPEAVWDDLDTSFEFRSTRAYVEIAKELKTDERA